MPTTASSRTGAHQVRDALLVCLTFASGAVDAISYFGLGRVFTALMSGNIILLGLAAGRAAAPEALRSAVSLVMFVVGVLVASRVCRGSQAGRLWPVGVTITFAIEAVAQAGLLAGWLAVAGRPGAELEAGLVAVSALAMGLQSGAVARLGVAGVSTTYVTGTLTGLIGALATGASGRADRVRRALVLIALLAGAGCSALLLKSARPLAPVLPLATTLVVVLTAMRHLHTGADADGSPGHAHAR